MLIRLCLMSSVGEYVLLSTKFLRLSHVGRDKLLNKCLKPFEILSRKGAVAYEVGLPASIVGSSM